MIDFRPAAKLLWHFHIVYDALSPADVIVGLGSYDLRVASRCAELYQQGLASRIVFSGARGNWTQDLFDTSEAEAFKAHATAEGVPGSAILLEPRATNIGENMRFCRDLLPRAKKVIIVTKPQTQRRAKATAEMKWTEVQNLVTAPNVSYHDQPLKHHSERALVNEMVGDLMRMDEYAQRGFQTAVPIPSKVRTAAEILIEAGFSNHLRERRAASFTSS